MDTTTALTVVSLILPVLVLLAGVLIGRRMAPHVIVPRFNDHQHQNAPRTEFDRRRGESYPAVPNTWYALAYSSEVCAGQKTPLHIRALGQSFVVWRTSTGKLVVQSAWCPHQGANLGVGGSVKDDCIECPFHSWKFSENGDIKHVPAAKDPDKPQTARSLRTYPCRDWLGMALVYFHADHKHGDVAEWFPPEHIENQIAGEGWVEHVKADFGIVPLSPIDWVDQASDHSHFHALHGKMLLPWTKMPIPEMLFRLFPITIQHKLETYLGDSEEWFNAAAFNRRSEKGNFPLACSGRQYMFFTDDVMVLKDGKPLESTASCTLEMYIGPSIMCFHIPFGIGNLKVVVCTTPMEGHSSLMRVRTFVDSSSVLVRAIGWLVAGVSASQLAADIDIMSNKVRLRKPMKQLFDGPQSKVAKWLNQFYSDSSINVGCGSFVPDW